MADYINLNVMVNLVPEDFITYLSNFEYNPWVFSIIGSILVGLSGILPLLVIPIEEGANLKHGGGARTLKVLLSFAVGGLLGDVFLHLLPEAWSNDVKNSKNGHPSLFSGMMLLSGMLLFIVIEKLFSGLAAPYSDSQKTIVPDVNKEKTNNNTKDTDKEFHQNGYTKVPQVNGVKKELKNGELKNGIYKNGFTKKIDDYTEVKENNQHTSKHVAGYLNLMANCIDNFTHGLAVGGSFLISFRLGALTTFAILVHEIPHEVGDFAILLKSGFSRWDAARAQLVTSCGGLLGSLVAVASSGGANAMEGSTSWILPFTAGGFLHIALVTVLPDLLKEDNAKESAKQFIALIFGIIVMATLTVVLE